MAAQSQRGADWLGDQQRTVHATVIYNPTAGHGTATWQGEVHDRLTAQGWHVSMEGTQAAGAATELAAAAVARGDDVVIVAGGDGTINEAIQALAGSPVALGVLPVGTVNVWAREIGLPIDPLAAAQVLIDGQCRNVDLGRAGDRYFLLMAGAGFDGAVTGLVEPTLKRTMGRWAYVVTAVRLALRYGGATATLELDGATVRCRLLLAVIGNTRLYGGRLQITGQAVADDGLLDVVIFSGRRPWDAAPLMLSLLLRRRTVGPGVLYYRTRHLRILTGATVPVQADGDYIGTNPREFGIAPSALRVIVPHSITSSLFQQPPLSPEALASPPGSPPAQADGGVGQVDA